MYHTNEAFFSTALRRSQGVQTCDGNNVLANSQDSFDELCCLLDNFEPDTTEFFSHEQVSWLMGLCHWLGMLHTKDFSIIARLDKY